MVDYYWTIIRYLGLPIAFLLLRDYTNYNKKLSNSGGGPLAHFFIAVFWFYQSVFRDDTSPVIGGEMPISWHMNVKWYRYGQPKAGYRRHFDRSQDNPDYRRYGERTWFFPCSCPILGWPIGPQSVANYD